MAWGSGVGKIAWTLKQKLQYFTAQSLMSHRAACCHTCYTIQLRHYSHFKTHSLQHLKPIKCSKRVCKYKTPTCFGLFPRPSSGGPALCFVPLLFLPLICVRWVRTITRYVAACVCHLCVFDVLQNTKHTQMTNTHATTYRVIIRTQRIKCSNKTVFKPLITKRTPLYLKTHSVPRCKHFSSRLWKPISLWCDTRRCLFWDK